MIWYLAGGFIFGLVIMLLILLPKLRITQTIDEVVKNKNEELKTQCEILTQQEREYSIEVESLQTKIMGLKIQTETAKENFSTEVELLNEKMSSQADIISKNYSDYIAELNITYTNEAADLAKGLSTDLEKIKLVEDKLKELQAKQQSVTDAFVRAEEIEKEKDFYRIVLSQEDIKEIEELRQVKLRNEVPLNKVIWKVYYETPFNAMLGRIIGGRTVTGIYKITNLVNGKCYVGQANDLASRWKQHVKCGLGAEQYNNSKLYPEMYKLGVENFTFEILEECAKEELDEREDWYQDFYSAKTFGYSIK